MTTLLTPISEQNVGPVAGIDEDVEPDAQWKESLRARIEKELQSTADKVREDRDSQLRGIPEGSSQWEAVMKNYNANMDRVRRIAQEQFNHELKIARFERSLALGKEVEGAEFEQFRLQQQAIWEAIKKGGTERPHGRRDSSVVPSPNNQENGDPVPPRASGEHDTRGGPSMPYRDSRPLARGPPASESRTRDRTQSGGSDQIGTPASYGTRPSRSRGNSSVFGVDFDPTSSGSAPYDQGSIGRQSLSSLSRTRPQDIWLPTPSPKDNSSPSSRTFAHATASNPSPISPNVREGTNDNGRTVSRTGSMRSTERPSPLADFEPGSSLPRDRFGMGSAEDRSSSRKGKEPDRSDHQRQPSFTQQTAVHDIYARRPDSRMTTPNTPSRPTAVSQGSEDQYFPQISPVNARYRQDPDEVEGIPIRSSRRSVTSDQGSPENMRYGPPNSASARPIPPKRSFPGDFDSWAPQPPLSNRPYFGPQSPPPGLAASSSRPIPRPSTSDEDPRLHSPSGAWYDPQSPLPFAGYDVPLPFNSNPHYRYSSSPAGSVSGRRNSNGSRSVRSRSSRQEFWGPSDVSQRPLPTFEEQSVASDSDSDEDYGMDLDDLWHIRERQELRDRHQLTWKLIREEQRRQEVANKAQEAKRLEEEARRKQEEAARKEEEARQKAEEARRKEEEVKLKALEIQQKQEELARREAELLRREAEAKLQEEIRKREEAEARLQEEIRKRQEAEAEAKRRVQEEAERRDREQREREAREKREREEREERERREREERERRDRDERERKERERREKDEREKSEKERQAREEKERRQRENEEKERRDREERERREEHERRAREQEEWRRRQREQEARLAQEKREWEETRRREAEAAAAAAAQAQLESERLRAAAAAAAEAEAQRQWEERRRREEQRQREVEAQKQREEAAEAQRQREEEAQCRRAEAQEREAQRQMEAEAQRQREAEAQRQREAEAQRQREAEAQRQREAEAQRQREAEAQRQRELELKRRQEADALMRREAADKAAAERAAAEAEAQRRQEAEARQREAGEAQARAAEAERLRRRESPAELAEFNDPQFLLEQQAEFERIQAQREREAKLRAEAAKRRQEEEARKKAQFQKEQEEIYKRIQAEEQGRLREQEARRRAEEDIRRKQEQQKLRENAILNEVLRRSEEEHRDQEERRRKEGDRRRQDSVGSSSDSNRPGVYFSASSSAPRPIPNPSASFHNNPSIPGDRSSTASSSSFSSSASFFSTSSGRSNSTGYTSSASRTSTASATPTAVPATPSVSASSKAGWKSAPSPATPSPTTASSTRSSSGAYQTAYGSQGSYAQSSPSTTRPTASYTASTPLSEQEWARRQEEHARKQFEQFQREQEAQQRRAEQKAMRQLSKEDVIKLFEEHERRWSRLMSMDILTWHSFPWPMLKQPTDPEQLTYIEIQAYVLSPHQPGDKTQKERIKDYLRKWHPDRFETKVLPKVREDEREIVKEGAGAVARHLNKLLSSLSGSAENGLFG